MKVPVAVVDITEELTFDRKGLNGYSVEMVASEEGQPSFLILDIRGTDTCLTFVPLDGGGWKLVVFDYKDEADAFEQFIEELDYGEDVA